MIVDSHPGKMFTGTSGNDKLIGTGHDDHFDMSQGGDDQVKAGDGNDGVFMGATLTATDKLDGGEGYNSVELRGDYSQGLTLGAKTLTGFQNITLDGGYSYNITLDAKTVGPEAHFLITAYGLTKGQSAYIDASAVVGHHNVLELLGGGGDDTFIAGKAETYMLGESGHDLFVFGDASTHNRIAGFNHHDDTIRITSSSVSGFDDLTVKGDDQGNTFISWQNHPNAIELVGTAPHDVDATDFIFGAPDAHDDGQTAMMRAHERFAVHAAGLHAFM